MILGEVECLKRMRHPNIVNYHGAWRENNRSYILMEYATRGTLKDLLNKRKQPLKEQDALYLFSQITLGVHHIHSKQILHRDLKPENIMLTGRYGDIIKIGDFGVSRNVHEEPLTHRIGTFHYMAPEMLKREPYNLKCDIWSMGVVLYQMIANHLPFPATTVKDIIKITCTEKPRPIVARTSASTVTLISKMLKKEAYYRPRTSQLLMCPYLVPSIARVYLNLGRQVEMISKHETNFSLDVFTGFLKSLR
ncbi:serine/threonine-protein kinase nekl-2 isoform X2 [Cephus cinctus]|nr:serine/threonine-protein kinase nekl-2 isoform X2 [Cephus cinctus]